MEIARKTNMVASAWRIVKAKRMASHVKSISFCWQELWRYLKEQVLLIFGVSISISPGGAVEIYEHLKKLNISCNPVV